MNLEQDQAHLGEAPPADGQLKENILDKSNCDGVSPWKTRSIGHWGPEATVESAIPVNGYTEIEKPKGKKSGEERRGMQPRFERAFGAIRLSLQAGWTPGGTLSSYFISNLGAFCWRVLICSRIEAIFSNAAAPSVQSRPHKAKISITALCTKTNVIPMQQH